MQVEKSVEKDAGNMRNVYCLGTSLIGPLVVMPEVMSWTASFGHLHIQLAAVAATQASWELVSLLTRMLMSIV